MHVKIRVAVNVGLTKQVLAIGYGEARLFFHLASHAFFGRLADVRKATGKVERSLAWVFLTTLYKQFALGVNNESHIRTTRIEEIFETTTLANLTLFAVLFKA